MTWAEVIQDPSFSDLETSDQQFVRQTWVDNHYLPKLKAAGVPDADIEGLRTEAVSSYDNGQGYISSFANAVGRGAASTFTSAVQGVGALTGSDGIEQVARDMDSAVTENLTINPEMEKTNFTGNVLGNVAGFLAPGAAGMRLGNALGVGAKLGASAAANIAIFASGAGSGAQLADQYGIEGPERTGMVLGHAATETLSEHLPFGLGSELGAMGRIAGLSDNVAKKTGGFFSEVLQNTGEEMAANVGSNAVTMAMAPEGMKTPGLMDGNVQAGIGGAIGGAAFGGINLMVPTPSEKINEGATQRALENDDPAAAAILQTLPGAKLEPILAPEIPGSPEFDPTLDEALPVDPLVGGAPEQLIQTARGVVYGLTSGDNPLSLDDLDMRLENSERSIAKSGQMDWARDTLYSPHASTRDYGALKNLMATPEGRTALRQVVAERMQENSPPAADAPPVVESPPPEQAPIQETPPEPFQGVAPNELIDQHGRLSMEGAQSMIGAIQSLGLTTAPFVINDTGTPDAGGPLAKGSTSTVDGEPTIFLNQGQMTLDTPLHETFHRLTPTLREQNAPLYGTGASLLRESPLYAAVAERYQKANLNLDEAAMMDEAMVTGLANNGADWLNAYAGNSRMTRAIKEFLAKVREWFDGLMHSKGFDPDMSLDQFYKKVNRQVLAGKLKDQGPSGTSVSLDTPSQPNNHTPSNEPTDARTGRPTSISGPTFDEQRRADVSRTNRSRMGQAQRLGEELLRGKQDSEGFWRAVESSQLPRVPAGSLRLHREGANLVSTDGSLRSLPPGAEAVPFADDTDGVVYKLFPLKNDKQNGVKLAPKKGPDGWTVDSAPANLLETLEKIALLHDIGGVPSEIVGITDDMDILVKQPLLTELSPDQKANIGPIRDQAVASVGGQTLKGRKFKDVRLVVRNGQPYFVGDLHPGNIMLDAQGQPIIMDALVVPVPERMRYDEAELDAAIKRATQKPPLAEDDSVYSLAPRHAALEQKHNAGAITPAETAEAQGIVDAAAKAAGTHPKQIDDIKEIATLHRSAISRTGMGEGQLERLATGLESAGRYGMGGFIYVSFQRPATDISLGMDGATAKDTNDGWGFIATPTPLPVKTIMSKRIAPIGDALNYAAAEVVFSGLASEVKNASGEYSQYLWSRDLVSGDLRLTQTDKTGPWGHYSKEEALHSRPPTWGEAVNWINGTLYDERLPKQIKSADPFTGVPLEQRFDTASKDIRYSLAPVTPQDRAYVAAVESGDVAAQQAIVDQAAKAAGFTEKLFNGRKGSSSVFPSANGIFLSNERVASGYGPPKPYMVNLGRTVDYDEFLFGEDGLQDVIRDRVGEWTPEDIAAHKQHADIYDLESGSDALDDGAGYALQKNPDQTDVDGFWFLGGEVLRNIGADSVRRDYTFGGGQPSGIDEFVIFDPAQLKSADPITYDDNGKILLPSQRFDTTSNDIRYSLAPAIPKPSNVARNQQGTRVRNLMEDQTYEGQTMDAASEEATSLYNANVDNGFTAEQHMAFVQDLRTNAERKFQDMTFGAYGGIYMRDLLDEANNPERDPGAQEFAKQEAKRLAAVMAKEAATGGRQAKAFDIFNYIANTPEMTVRQQEELLPFDSKQSVKDEFDKAAATANKEMEDLANEAIAATPADTLAAKLGQQTAAVVKGQASADVGEVVLEEVKPPETEEDLPAWFREGQDALGAELSAVIDEITTRIQFSAWLNRKAGTFSLSAEERSANLAAMIAEMEASGQTVAQAKAANDKRIAELTRKFKKGQAKPMPKEAPPEAEVKDIAATRMNRLLDKIVKPAATPAKTRTQKEALVDAIVSTMMAKAGLPADLKAGNDNVTLAFALVVANPDLAAQSVQAVYDLLQSDPDSADITTSDKIRGFMQMMTGKAFSDGKPYGEKQLNAVLNNELKRLQIRVSDVAMDAALTGKTVDQLEAALRDPTRELSKVLSPEALNKVVAAVTGEFRKTAAERVAKVRQREAEAKVRKDAADARRKDAADARRKEAAAKAEVTKAEESVRTAMKKDLKEAQKHLLDTMAKWKKAQDDLAAQTQREVRDAMAAEERLVRKDREYKLALKRKARKEMRRKLAKRGGFMIPLDADEATELLDQKPKNVLQYLTREYGFNLQDIIAMAREEDRQSTLEAKVTKLAEALGLTKEQADKFMGPVIAEAMKHISEARKKDVAQRINRVLEPVIAKKKTQKTEAEKLIKLAEMGGLTADNVEKLLLNSKDAKEFTPEFRQHLIDLIAQANDPHLTQISRDLRLAQFLDEIAAARGITALGMLGEWTMSNIFMSILSTFKVNFVWGGIKAATDSAIYMAVSGPADARADAEAKGVTPASHLATTKALFRQWLHGYAWNMQHNASFMWAEGKSKDETDYTSQFANTGMELMAHNKDAQILWSADGKPMPKSAQYIIKKMAAFGKYTRRTMVASDLVHRTSGYEMSKALEAIKVVQAKGKAGNPATLQKEIDDALYGGSFKDAFAKANKQADDEIAAKQLGKAERGIRVGQIMDQMLGKSLGLSPAQTQEALEDSRENAKRWSLANQTEGIFGQISNLMLAGTRSIPGLKYLLPAIRMPIAAFSQTLDWTPYGFLRHWAIGKNSNETESLSNYLFNRKGKFGNWNKPDGGVPAYRKSDLMAKATIGSMIMIGLCIKAALSFDEDEDEADFYITGMGPTDPAENKAWREKGNLPFTFRFNGGAGFRYQESPFYGMLAPIGAWSDAHRYGKPGEAESDRLAYAFGKSLSGFQEAVVMKNLSDILAGGSSYSPDGQLRNWSKSTSRLVSNVLMPRIGGEINTILYGPQDQKALGWGGRALANVPFVPSFNNKPAQDFLGREIHTKREGPLGEIYPALAHRILAPSLDDPILNFVSKMSPNFLATTRRFKDGTKVMDNYEFVRKWNAAAGVKIREYLTPARMAAYEKKLAEDKAEAQTEFNADLNKIRTEALRKFSEVQF